jgi:hypothetical protein
MFSVHRFRNVIVGDAVAQRRPFDGGAPVMDGRISVHLIWERHMNRDKWIEKRVSELPGSKSLIKLFPYTLAKLS